MRKLDPGYSAEVDSINEDQWYQLLREFDDANIYQTWAYGEVRNGRGNISHLVLKEKGLIVAIAQSRIVRVPLIGAGIAYVMQGPLWRRTGTRMDSVLFRQMIRALRNEYVSRRGLYLRLYPNLFEEEAGDILPALGEEGFVHARNDRRPMTLIMDLGRSLEDLRSGMRPHWQRELKMAEKQKMEIKEGNEDELMEQFIKTYREMVARKQFREPNDINEFRAVQEKLPDDLKMKIMLCGYGEAASAGAICSAIGERALYLFGATSNAGMKSRGSYLLQWKLIGWLKTHGVAQYDLNGINRERNPGTYKFKSDLVGEKGREVRFIGQFDSCDTFISRVSVSVGEWLRGKLNRAGA